MRTALAGLLVLALAAAAHANGRDPFTSTINFRAGNDQHVVAGMTFGLVVSKDGGATWQWMCEDAVGYSGMYDPDYVYTASGALFATTFDGLKVMRDGCNFVATPPGMTFASKAEQGPDGALYFTAADATAGDSKIYKSTDDGASFPTSANPGQAGDWWSSLATAPSNANRVYVTGYRFEMSQPKVFLLFTSNDGGTSFTPMTTTGISPISPNSVIELVGVDANNDQTVYVKVTFEDGSKGDSIYRSTNAGGSWTKLLSRDSNFGLAFLARKGGGCVAGTRDQGAWYSAACNATWVDLPSAPHIGCLYENAAGEVWACTQNYASPQLGISSDGFGIMKSTDLSTWTGVLKYQDIQSPVPCAAGTMQEDRCVQRYKDQASQWCCLVAQLGVTSSAISCTGDLECKMFTVDVAPDGVMVKPPDGCCGTAAGRSSALLALLVAAALLRRGRRPKER